MKKLFLLLITGLFLLAPEAKAAPAEAVFTASPNERILLFLNNRPVNHTPTKQVVVRSRPGKHKVQIQVYNLRGRLKLIHNDKILIQPRSTNQFLLEVHPFKGSRLVSVYARPKYRGHERRVAPSPPVPPRMSFLEDGEFRHLIFTLQKISDDRVKLEVAEDVLRGHYIYSEDVKEIMFHLAYESNRVAFAKHAYRQVADPEKFEVVFDALRYDSSIRQLRYFLSGR